MHAKTIILLSVFFIVAESKIPDYIKVCNSSDPNINDCIKNSVYGVVPYLKKGIPELNVPPLEPFHVKNIKINTGSGGVSTYAILKDIMAWNGTTFEILDVKSDIPKNWYQFSMKIPNLYLTGNYEVNVKILAVPVVGDGHFNLNITNLNFTCTAKGNLYDKDGVTRIKYDRLRFKVSYGAVKINLENLFNNDPTLGKATNEIINNNADVFYEVLQPIVEETLSDVFSEITDKITESFEYNELYAK